MVVSEKSEAPIFYDMFVSKEAKCDVKSKRFPYHKNNTLDKVLSYLYI